MKEELEIQLVSKYPDILRDYKGDKMVTCMHWGMECQEGWYDLLDDLMSKLDFLSKTSGVQVVADQIKEKFGTLRFYYSTIVNGEKINEVIFGIIGNTVDAAEKMSENTCEVCGKYGELRNKNGWLKTCCDKCAEEKGYALDKSTQ
jgi:hypothetical protein